MKFFSLASGSFLFAFLAYGQALQCGQNKVANSISLCIEPEYIEGCETYKWINQCDECQSGYHLNEGKCDFIQGRETSQQIIGCLEKSKNGQCVNCANGYVLEQGKCKKGTKNCIQYDSDMLCTDCKPDYSLLINQCKHNILLGCKEQSQDHNCKQCWAPFQLNGNHCDIKNCQSLNDYGCVNCKCGFYITNDRKCKQIDSGCLRYQRGHCVNCLSHYKLKGGFCQIEGCLQYENHYCLQCKEDYELTEGGCKFKNCNDWAHDQCLVCEKGFKISKGKCVQGEDLVCE